MRALLRWALSPVVRLLIRMHVPGDDWEEVPARAAPWRFGSGSRKSFSWYFEGESVVRVTSIAEIVDWLADCEYVSDKHLFQENDFWQHPRTFERLRQGDCEDFALWGWRKLNEIGVPARLFVGRHLGGGSTPRGHAWVVFEAENGPMLLETSHRSAEHAVRPLEEARLEYRPHHSVDRFYRTTSYCGWLTSAKEDLERKRKYGVVDVVGT